MSYNIVLVCPEIPQNTGNIGRLCVSTESNLHLIKPLGFSLDEKHLKRAGMDYWQHLNLSVYENWEEFISKKNQEADMYFFSTKCSSTHWDCPMSSGDYLVFGNEGSGLPSGFYDTYKNQLYTIPMPGAHCRSLNLANSVSIVLYEGLRKTIQ
jgi:tRNA (cytidine/uridine-2'-O-)-methyltransferase